jgi:uncharacterized protein (DUF4213/DUF364 family)
MMMTAPACPMRSYLTEEVRETILAEFDEVGEVEVRLVWEPGWSPRMISERGRRQSAGSKEERAMELVSEWLSDLRTHVDYQPAVTDVRVGVFYTAVAISGGEVGVAFTPRDLSDSVCCPKTAAGAPPAGRLGGVKAWELANYAIAPSPLRRAIGVATLNALSAAAIARNGLPEGLVREDLDGLAAAEVAPDDAVVMVGAFIPFIKALKGRVADLRVIDKHPGALKSDEQDLWVSPEGAQEALSKASVVILSGSTLVEGGAEELLNLSKAARVRVMAGPTTPLWPSPFFSRGIDVLAGIEVLNGREMLTIVGQGGSGYFFEKAARKTCVIKPSAQLSTRPNPGVDTHPKALSPATADS